MLKLLKCTCLLTHVCNYSYLQENTAVSPCDTYHRSNVYLLKYPLRYFFEGLQISISNSKWRMSTYLFPSCNNNSLYRHLWLVYNQCSGSTSFSNQNTQRRNNIPLHHIVAHSHQLIQCPFGILVDLILICFLDWAHIQMDMGL